MKKVNRTREVFIMRCPCGQEMELRTFSDIEWNVQCHKCGKRHKGMGREITQGKGTIVK